MTTSQRTGRRRVAFGAAAVLAVLCCAAPGLLAGGALAGLAATIGSPWFIGAAAALVLAGGARGLIRRLEKHSYPPAPHDRREEHDGHTCGGPTPAGPAT